MPKFILFYGLCILSVMAYAQELEVTASVDKNPVMADESFILSVIANGDVDRNAFDSSSLLGDFVVGRTSVSSQTQMINFDTTKTTTWSTVLIPRKQGRFTIPALDVAGEKTQPIDVLVVPVSASSAAKGRDLFITTSVDIKEAYLQQQIHYQVKLHLGKDLQRGSLSTPKLDNADIRQIGKDKEYNEIVDGRRYRIIERSFAIIPQKSGSFTIEGPLFEGEVIDNSRQSFGFFNRSKTINRVGPNQNITVLPIPNGYTEHWLPSDFVQLDDEWQGNAAGFIAGEPITRTLTLTAIGVVEEQLPNIPSLYPQSVKTYPDQAETTTVEKDNALIAQRKESIAIIPSQAGELLIPEVKIPWFNTITQKTEFARLPEKTIQVLPAMQQPVTNIPASLVENAEPIPPPTSKSSSHSNAPVGFLSYSSNAIILVVLALWTITLVLWWQHVRYLKSKGMNSESSVVRKTQSEQELWKRLEKAMSKNNAAETQKYLSLWLGTHTNHTNSSLTESLSVINNLDLTNAVNALLATRYSKHPEQWSAAELQKILRKIRKQGRNAPHKMNQLSPLYPNH